MHQLLYGSFLYFPEDKSTYIPAVLEFLVIMVLVFFVFRWFVKKSKRDAEVAKQLEERLMNERKERVQQNIQK